MSDTTVSFGDEAPVEPAGTPPGPAAPPPANRSAPTGSILAAIQDESGGLRGDARKVYPFGTSGRFFARYRPLDDNEEQEHQAAVEQRRKLRQKTQRDDTRKSVDVKAQLQESAILLALTCETILFLDDDGTKVPLHEFLARPDQMGENAPKGPIRFDRDLASVMYADLADELGRQPANADVCKRAHRRGDATKHDHAQLATNAQFLQVWLKNASAEALEEALEGS